MVTILVAEDDAELAELWRVVLEGAGYEVLTAGNGAEALELATGPGADLAICDVMMPVMDGFTLVRELRGAGLTLPVLLITAKGALADKHEGFAAGADDYVVKPVDVNEMLWRVEALLRRARIASEHELSIGGTTLDADALTVRCGAVEETLPQKEFWLLFKLLASPGRVFTRRQLLDDVWGVEADAGDHTLDVHISRLRERFRGNPDFSIVTVRGLGYKGVRSSD